MGNRFACFGRSAIFAAAGLFCALISGQPAKASFDLVNLGTGSFVIDSGATTAAYSQTTNALVFANTYALGDTAGGTFAGEARNWSDYATFGLSMTVAGANPELPFNVQFYDSSFNVINTYQSTTSGLSLTPKIVMLGLSMTGTADFSSVVGMQFTWDGGGAINTSINRIVGFAVPTSGFFVARAPRGAQFLTGTNALAPNLTSLAPAATNWTPPPLVALSAGGAAWASLSDSNAKTEITAVDHRETLRKVSRLPVTSWEYKSNRGRRYAGPMAQDFHTIFGLGLDDRRINTLDTDGVTLSALKGLIELWRERQALSEAQARRLRELQSELIELQRSLPQLPPVGP